MEKTLTPEAQIDRDNFEEIAAQSCCSCFIFPPCSYCTHPGNPMNQEDDSCWTISLDEMVRNAHRAVSHAIYESAKRQLEEMKAHNTRYAAENIWPLFFSRNNNLLLSGKQNVGTIAALNNGVKDDTDN